MPKSHPYKWLLPQDPEVSTAFQDISSNPANIIKYQNNPKVQALIQKLQSKFGADMGAPGSGGGLFGNFGGGPPPAGGASSSSGGVPEQPDID